VLAAKESSFILKQIRLADSRTNSPLAAQLDNLKLKTLLGSITSAHQPSSVSLWDYLKEELTAADFESTQELKRERVANFLSVPIAFEKASQIPVLLWILFLA